MAISTLLPLLPLLPPLNNDAAVSRNQIEIFSEARELVPRPGCWGVYAFDDGPVIAGGGDGGLLWFPSHEGLLLLLDDCAAVRSSLKLRETRQRRRALAPVMSGAACCDAAKLDAIKDWNHALKGFLQVVWYGDFCELLSGDSDFAHEIRIWYRSRGTVTAQSDAPIEAAEHTQFAAALQEFGL